MLRSLLIHHHSLGLKKRPHLISSRALVHYFSFLLLFIITLTITKVKAPEILGFSTDVNVVDLLFETNNARFKNKVSEVKLNNSLSIAAEKKAQDMFANNYWSHTSPSGLQPWDFILGQNYDYIYAGENLARDFATSKGIVEAWLNSPSHRDNLLNTKYVDMGLAVVNGNLDGTDTTLVVQMFGTLKQSLSEITEPASVQFLSVEEEISNVTTEEPNQVIKDFENGAKRQPQIMQLDLPISQTSESALISVNKSTHNVVMYFSILLLVLFTVDCVFVYANRHEKHTGHGEVHILYILYIILGVLIVRAGDIL